MSVQSRRAQLEVPVGAPTTKTMHDKRLTTTVDWKDTHGRSLSAEKRSQMHRLRKWQTQIRTRDAGERNLQFALSEIDRMTSALGVPRSIREITSVLYRRALADDLVRGRSIEGVATSALYAACRQERIPRSLDEVVAVSRVGWTEVGRTYRFMTTELGLEMLAADAGLLSGRSPTRVAAAALYAASLLCNEHRTQREIANVAQVTEVTIRNRSQEQLEAMGLQ